MLTQKTRYALRALLYLIEEGHGDAVQLQRIADTQKIPRKFLELIMLDLKALGIVKSVRGPKGGYRLTRHPQRHLVRGSRARPRRARSRWSRAPASTSTSDAGTVMTRRPAPFGGCSCWSAIAASDVLNSVSLEEGARWELRLTDPPLDDDDPIASRWQSIKRS